MMNTIFSSILAPWYALPVTERRITSATVVTLMRIAVTPFMVYAICVHSWCVAFGLFLFGAFTDALDGFLARYLNQRSFLGAVLDPVADKIFIISTVVALFYTNSIALYLPFWFVCLLFCKEIMQILGAVVLYKKRGYSAIEANVFGKATMVLQVIFVCSVLGGHLYQNAPNFVIQKAFLWSISGMMILSFMQYGYVWRQRLNNKYN